MAKLKSSIKRIKVSERNRFRNKALKSAIKTLIKKYLFQCLHFSKHEINLLLIQLNNLYSYIDKAVTKKLFHKNKAARLKSKLCKRYLLIKNTL